MTDTSYGQPGSAADYGSGLDFGGGAGTAGPGSAGADVTPAPVQPIAPTPNMQGPAPAAPSATPSMLGSIGSGISSILPGPHYAPPDPQATALDQTADMLQQRIKRANSVASNPLLQVFAPEGVQAARQFLPAATEQLQKIRAQKADMQANRTQAATLGLDPGEVPDEASQADRLAVAQQKALKGNLQVFKGLQAVDPKAAEAIQDQVHEAVAGHLTKAQYAFDSLSGMQNQGQYAAKLGQFQKDGTLSDLETLGLKVPPTFDGFNATKGREGQALREARIGIDTIRQKLEERNTYQPMEKKEAETYNGRLTTAYGDQITNGTWGRNGAAGTRGLIVNGMANPNDLGTKFTLATPDQRKAIKEEFDGVAPQKDVEKYRSFNRIYQLATTDNKGNAIPSEGVTDAKGNKSFFNTNPNVQQGVAEGLASMLRGGSGGATSGLLNIESNKRGAVQTVIDKIVSNYSGGINAISGSDIKPYLSQLTQEQIRSVLDGLKTYGDKNIGDRVGSIAQRAGALGLDAAALGLGSKEATGAIGDALEAGRKAQIARMTPNHQAIGGGDGVLQLGAQRPGANAIVPPNGAAPATTQLPGAQPVATPVQQAQNPQPGAPQPGAGPGAPQPGAGPGAPQPGAPQPGAPQPGAPQPGAPQPGAPTAPGGGLPPGPGAPQPGAPTAPQPQTIAGQPINVALPAGASPRYVAALQRIESGNERSPWIAGAKGSSASGAFQFINSTWAANKPPGAPARAADATPAQQAAALATLTTKNAATLTNLKLPVNDTTLYMAHNVGAGGAASLLSADPGADARKVVGEDAARNNPMFFKGRPTVATVLQRYQDQINTAPDDTGPKPRPGAGGATAEAPGLMTRISRLLSQGISGGDAEKDAAVKAVGNAAVEYAPAIASTIGAVGGSTVGPAGTIAGGAAGGAAGQSFKDYMQGNKQDPAKIAKEAALGGVFGVGGAARPVLGAAARMAGAGAVEAGADAYNNGVGADNVDAGLRGAASAAGGEAFGRALGMVGHKVFSMFAPEARATVQNAAKEYADASATLRTEAPKLPTAGDAAGGPNPKYQAAEATKTKAETVLKDAGLNPDEAAYAHKVSAEAVPKQEAQAARPGAMEQQQVGAGYQQLENEVGAAGKGAPKASPALSDGPVAVATSGKMAPELQSAAERAEMAVTAPAANWQDKWVQLKDERSKLLQGERDALTSTATGRTRTANDYRDLGDAVRVQQAKIAKYVFGEKDGEAFMGRLKVLDTRYRNLMDATNGMDLAKAAALKGEAGRDAERKFVAFAHDDPDAVSAYRAMRGTRGDAFEATVPWTVAAEGIPGIGKVVKVAKLSGMLREWARERAAGSPAKFTDLVKLRAGSPEIARNMRDLGGTAVQRGAMMQ